MDLRELQLQNERLRLSQLLPKALHIRAVRSSGGIGSRGMCNLAAKQLHGHHSGTILLHLRARDFHNRRAMACQRHVALEAACAAGHPWRLQAPPDEMFEFRGFVYQFERFS